jgi:hypothetical protein
MKTILLIDDTLDELKGLEAALRAEVSEGEASIIAWQPTKKDILEPVERLEKYLDDYDVAFVVTDYDLTGEGGLGLYGSTVVDHCQLRAVPVGDYSRGSKKRLPSEPSLFEIRVPTDSHAIAAKHIAAVFRGFEEIRVKVEQLQDMPRSPSAGIATILERPNDQSQFSLYGVRYPSVNSGLFDRIEGRTLGSTQPQQVRRLFAYVSGHVLLNLVLRYPGPIVSLKALAAYCAVSLSEAARLREIFKDCQYDGPFRDCDELFWLNQIDAFIDGIAIDPMQGEVTSGELNRVALEKLLNAQLSRPTCSRCDGKNGGFLCPFTGRTVCLRSDCSLGSNGWIPAGARLSRIEKEFYDEWAPLLGM